MQYLEGALVLDPTVFLAPAAMSASPRCNPKRKREQSVEAPKVRRSARLEAKLKLNEYPESVMERAMNLKKVQSLESNPPRSSQTSQQGQSPVTTLGYS